MNSLSWLIYIAGATSSLCVFLVLMCVALATLTVILTIVALLHLDKTDAIGGALPPDKCKDVDFVHDASRRWAIRFGVLFVVLGLFASLLPERRTVLLIAASEIGERTLNSERMAVVGDRMASVINPSIDLLNTWIEKQTRDIKAEMATKEPATTKSDRGK